MPPGGRKRLVYGVHGYGRGHASRAQAVLPELLERHDVLVLAGDDAYDQLRKDFPVTRIPVLRYYHNDTGRRSIRLTLQRNTPAALDLLWGGPISQMVRDEIRRFQPDAILSDSEAWTHRAGRALGIPRISFDHYGIMVHCRLDMSRWERLAAWMESGVYRRIVCRPDRVIVTAFYPGEPKRPHVRTVGPILRGLVRQTSPRQGDHLMVYFSNGPTHYSSQVHQALLSLDHPVKVYGLGRKTPEGNIEFRPAGNQPFVEDLAGCRAVFATAGNQLISEAIHFGKPLLLMPEDSLEQQLNARYIHKWRIGRATSPGEISPSRLKRFLAEADDLATRIPDHRRDGLAEAIEAIEADIRELTRR